MEFTGSGPFDHSDSNDVVYDFIIELSENIENELASSDLDACDLPEIHTKLGVLLKYLEIPLDPCIAKNEINLSGWKERIQLCFAEADRWNITGWPSENKEKWKVGILGTLASIEKLTR